MAYLVITYPELQQTDFDWIEEYRSRHDRQFSLVKPHITIVFGIQNIDEQDFLSEVKQRVRGMKPFPIEIKVATLTQYHSGSYYQEFLVPDTGYSDIVKLHDRLYSGLFRQHLRFDITYIPHVAIGDSTDPQTLKKHVDEVNAREILIQGRITAIDVIELDGASIRTVEKLSLTAE